MDFDDYTPTDADNRALRKELQNRDHDYRVAFIFGYIGRPLDEDRDQEWDMVAAWRSGQDWAIRDFYSRRQPTLKRRLAWWIKQRLSRKN